MELIADVYQILPPINGNSARGAWTKQDVVFEQKEEFNRKVVVSFWGDKTSEVSTLNVGDKVKVYFNIESREYNGRWFTELRAWRIEKFASEASDAVVMPPLEQIDVAFEDDIPF